MDNKTCGKCQFWVKEPTDPMNLSAPPMGECRFGPPTAGLLPTQNGPAKFALYPVLPPNYPACGQHIEKQSTLEVPMG